VCRSHAWLTACWIPATDASGLPYLVTGDGNHFGYLINSTPEDAPPPVLNHQLVARWRWNSALASTAWVLHKMDFLVTETGSGVWT
jgi:hypothetical protein